MSKIRRVQKRKVSKSSNRIGGLAGIGALFGLDKLESETEENYRIRIKSFLPFRSYSPTLESIKQILKSFGFKENDFLISENSQIPARFQIELNYDSTIGKDLDSLNESILSSKPAGVDYLITKRLYFEEDKLETFTETVSPDLISNPYFVIESSTLGEVKKVK